MPRLSIKIPRYRKHSSGQAFVEMHGARHYLGKHGSAASKQAYDRLVQEWLAGGRTVGPNRRRESATTIMELLAAYIVHAREYYPKLQFRTIRATRLLKELYGRTQAAEFGPLALRACRSLMVGEGVSRRYINDTMDEIKRIFKWGASVELVPADVHVSLSTVSGLAKGRTSARETEPVTPVSDDVVSKTLPHLPAIVADMVKLQRLTGVRPAELCSMRPTDIDGTGDVWVYRPSHHKTQYRGKLREVAIGPRAQEVLRPYLLRAPENYCFAPTESVAQSRRDKRLARKSKVQPSQVDRSRRKPKRKPGTKYDTASYRRAIHRACTKAGVPQWSPNQLRHTMATEVRRQFGLEAAQVALGHSRADVTQIYAEKNLLLATEVAAKIG
ncbi:MAG: site-specific integrase [Planctomycetota bacterium]|nr:site-specific integrase [Planctomycetota bacterium]MDA1179674.1 site-specific integrase [Planctomycetota bacterium]